MSTKEHFETTFNNFLKKTFKPIPHNFEYFWSNDLEN